MNQLTIQQLNVGDSATTKKAFTEKDVLTFAEVSSDYNPVHVDKEYPKETMFKKQIVHGMLVGSLFSAIFGVQMPGLGSIYTKQSLKFTNPVYFGDEIEATVTVREMMIDRNRVIFDCVAKNQNGDVVIVGEATIMPPKESDNA
ncbi:MAG: MaoC family dehydratase [Tenericutes bacterium]|jgi:3-hydroxybutyryl-CoA dehydratase|nr:MaoC family dehydratase [Mycoplasmatota bacterium]